MPLEPAGENAVVTAIRYLYLVVLIHAFRLTGRGFFIALYYRRGNILLSRGELYTIARKVREKPGDLLVFGVGNDSLLWHKLNRGHRTAFLEDKEDWIERIRARYGALEIHRVAYSTCMADIGKSGLEAPPSAIDLPKDVRMQKWPSILVDAPQGWGDAPGREQSIHEARRLVAPHGRIFVHDCDREAERYLVGVYLKDFQLRELSPRLWMFETHEA